MYFSSQDEVSAHAVLEFDDAHAVACSEYWARDTCV